MVMNEFPAGKAPHPLLQLMHDYRDGILNWEPHGMDHTSKVKRGRAKKRMGRESRRINRAN